MEMKRGVQSTDEGKKLTCPKSLCYRIGIQLEAKQQNRTPFWSKIRPIKPTVGTGLSEVKPALSPSSKLGVF